jgi:cytochrome c
MRAACGILVAALSAVGCGGGEPAGPVRVATAASQVATGGQLYAQSCAYCHGADGEGGRAPPLVGAGALPLDPRPGSRRNVLFHTAKDVVVWAQANMPADNPSSLAADQYYAIVAWVLSQDGIGLSGTLLDDQTASAIVLHP